MKLTHIIATFFGAGHLRPAPGTWGTAAGLIAGFALFVIGGWTLVAALIPAAFGLGLWATAEETRGKADHDPSEIVIDEVLGIWIALLPTMIGATHAGYAGWDALALWPGWLGAFLFFRLFDIWKPGPVGWADRRHGPLGVMLDDAIAGVMAALATGLAAYLWHGVLGL